MLREQFAEDEEFAERFKREAQNAAALSHPNIVQVYDRGKAGDHASYIAMEYVPGGTLKERISWSGPLDPGVEGVVIEQGYRPGTEVEAGTPVNLGVSSGPRQVATPGASSTPSPASATATASAAGGDGGEDNSGPGSGNSGPGSGGED